MQLLIWVLYLATDVYGHVALKAASETQNLQHVLFSPLGLSAGLAWVMSAMMWILILSKHPLLTANSVSTLTYALIAASAWLFFGEAIKLLKLLGMLLICVGIYLVAG
jgi:drug/metabolite transporter (DMT)-like permease